MAELYGDAAAVAKLAQALGASKEKAETSVRETLAKPTSTKTSTSRPKVVGSYGTTDFYEGGTTSNDYNTPISTSQMSGAGVPTSVPTPPTTNTWAGVNAGATAYTTSNPPPTVPEKTAAQLYQESVKGVAPIDSAQLLKDTQDEADLKEKSDKARALKARIDSINAQAEAAKQTLESQAGTGKDITGQFLGRQQQEIERQSAIQTLPLTAEYQAALGDYQAAQDTVNQLYTAKIRDLESQREYQLKVYETAYQIASDAEKKAIRAQEIAEERAYETQRDTIAFDREQSMLKYKAGLEGGASGSLGGLQDLISGKLTGDEGKTVLSSLVASGALTTAAAKFIGENTGIIQSTQQKVANAKIDAMVSNTSQLIGALENVPTGGKALAAQVESWIPYREASDSANAVKTYNALRNAFTGPVARVISQEVGVLTDKDVKRAQDILPAVGDNASVRATKVENLNKAIENIKSGTPLSKEGQEWYRQEVLTPAGLTDLSGLNFTM